MSWYSKVVWSEGLFLRPHHLQQSERYAEHLLESRVRHLVPYPWGFSTLEIDRDLAQQGRFAIRSGTGVMPDGTPFDMPADSPCPLPIEVSDAAVRQYVWLQLPAATANSREVDAAEATSGSRYVSSTETLIDSVSHLRIEEEIEIAHPRFTLEIRKTAKPGYVAMPVARILELHDKVVLVDERYTPPSLFTSAHVSIDGWLDRVIGWVEAKVDEFARYAADPTASGGLQNADYLMLQMLNRELPVLHHFRRSRTVHPERLFEEFLRIAGELATFASAERRARAYPPYDHLQLEACFAPPLRDIQEFLSARMDRRAIKLDITPLGQNAYISTITDRGLLQTSTLILEVAARRPLTEIQMHFPHIFKVGPNTRMPDIVQAHLPGIGLIHLPTPPGQIRALTDHVYFALDRSSPLWPEFSRASGIGMHFGGDWPDLQLQLWAVREDRR